MKRRKFIAIAGLGAAAVALPSLGYLATDFDTAIKGVVKRELHYLTLDEEGLNTYVKDFKIKYKNIRALEQKIKAIYLLQIGGEQSALAADIANFYLYSTDFFIKGMKEDQLVKYIGEYDPYLSPCANPFTSLHYPSIDKI